MDDPRYCGSSTAMRVRLRHSEHSPSASIRTQTASDKFRFSPVRSNPFVLKDKFGKPTTDNLDASPNVLEKDQGWFSTLKM